MSKCESYVRESAKIRETSLRDLLPGQLNTFNVIFCIIRRPRKFNLKKGGIALIIRQQEATYFMEHQASAFSSCLRSTCKIKQILIV